MEKKYISIDQLWKCETCFYMGSNGKCRSDCDAAESYRPAYSKFEFVDVAPVVHGRWETNPDDIYWGNAVKRKYCTACKKEPHFDRENRKFILTDYCPNCGAKMDEEEKHG